MQINYSNCLILKIIPYQDSLYIIRFLTVDKGALSAIFRNSKKNKLNVFQPGNWLQLTLFENKKSLPRIEQYGLSQLFPELQDDIIKQQIVCFLCDVLQQCLHKIPSDEQLFHFILLRFRTLNDLQAGLPYFHLFFLLELSQFLGFYPHFNADEQHKFLSLRDGHYVSVYDAHFCLNLESSQLLFNLSQQDFFTTNTLNFTISERTTLLHGISKIFDYQGFHFNLTSLEILKSIFY